MSTPHAHRGEMNAATAKIPPAVFVLSTMAGAFLIAGAIGLLRSDLAPMVATPVVAWSCIAVAVMLDGFAVAVLLGARKRQ